MTMGALGEWVRAQRWGRAARSACLGVALAAVPAMLVLALSVSAPAQDGTEELPKLLEEGNVHIRTKSWGAALKVYEQALKLDADNFEANYNIAVAYLKLENERAAEAHLAKAASLKPKDFDVAFLYGSTLVKLGKVKEAMKPLERVYGDNPDRAGLRASLGRLYFESGDFDKARSFLRKAVREDRKNPELRYYYGECLFRLERYDDAKDEFAAAAEGARGKAQYNTVYSKAAARQQQTARRIRTFGSIERSGRVFRNKAFKVTVTKPAGFQWGWFFPERMPERLIFIVANPEGTAMATLDGYPNNTNLTIGSQMVKSNEIKSLFKALELDFKRKHIDAKKAKPIRVLNQFKKQQTFCFSARRKHDRRVLTHYQRTLFMRAGLVYSLVVTIQKDSVDKAGRKELEKILQSIDFAD
jgi:tetratricopeptide (TPR) repeat protein